MGAIMKVRGPDGTVQEIPAIRGQSATIEIVGTETLPTGQEAVVEEAEGSTPQARKYIFKVPQGEQGTQGIPGLTYPVVDMTDSAAELAPNTYYKWGEVTALSITLADPTDMTITNEYCFEFVSGETATTLTVPSDIKWAQEPTIEANKTYQVSILNGIGVICGA